MYSLITKKYKDLIGINNKKVIIIQYEGLLYPGLINLAVGVSTKSRQEAFFLCKDIVEFIKIRIPIWKKEIYSDNSIKWINTYLKLCLDIYALL